ncbi:MAG: 50S ribosomal protein L24 [Bacilli bacterium]
MKILKGDKVIVISGKDKGKTGIVQRVYPKLNKVVVEGVNIRKKHLKPTQNNPEGGIQEIYAPIASCKVMYYDTKTKKGTRLGYKVDTKTGKKIRVAKKSKQEIK